MKTNVFPVDKCESYILFPSLIAFSPPTIKSLHQRKKAFAAVANRLGGGGGVQ